MSLLGLPTSSKNLFGNLLGQIEHLKFPRSLCNFIECLWMKKKNGTVFIFWHRYELKSTNLPVIECSLRNFPCNIRNRIETSHLSSLNACKNEYFDCFPGRTASHIHCIRTTSLQTLILGGRSVKINYYYSPFSLNCQIVHLQFQTHMIKHMCFQTGSCRKHTFAFGAVEIFFFEVLFLVFVEWNFIFKFHPTIVAFAWLVFYTHFLL